MSNLSPSRHFVCCESASARRQPIGIVTSCPRVRHVAAVSLRLLRGASLKSSQSLRRLRQRNVRLETQRVPQAGGARVALETVLGARAPQCVAAERSHEPVPAAFAGHGGGPAALAVARGGASRLQLVEVVARRVPLRLLRQEDARSAAELATQDAAEGELELAAGAGVDDRVH